MVNLGLPNLSRSFLMVNLGLPNLIAEFFDGKLTLAQPFDAAS